MIQGAILPRIDRPEASTYLDWASHLGLNSGQAAPTGGVWPAESVAGQPAYVVFNLDVKESWAQPFRRRMERARSELERLRDGWAGEHSKAPSDQTLSDVDQVLEAISSTKAVPEVEVDEDDGHVTFRWQKASSPIALSFVLRGKGQVTVVVTELSDTPYALSRQFPVESEGAIVRFLNRDDRLMDLLG